MKIVAIIQARTGSTRLPKKVLKKIEKKAMLQHVIDRIKRSNLIQEIIIATTTKREDEPIVKLAEESKVKWFRGKENDVLDRYYQAAKKFRIDVIVRITADCPLIDPKISDIVIEYFLKNRFDYVSNINPYTYPDGLDTEVFSFEVLKKAWKKARKASEREHVTSYILNHPEIFRIGNVENDKDFSHMRWVVDEESDLKFVREVYKRMYKNSQIFYMEDILSILKKEPKLAKINSSISRNEGYIKSLKEERILNLDYPEE